MNYSEMKAYYEALPEGKLRLPNGCVVGWSAYSKYRSVGCPECVEGKTVEGLTFEQAYEFAENHTCTTPKCKQCHRHIASYERIEDGVCWKCTEYGGRLANGKRVNITMMDRAFDLVKDPTNWKNPVSGIVNEKQVDVVLEAIGYHVGGGGQAKLHSIREQGKSLYKVVAPGYYQTIGS